MVTQTLAKEVVITPQKIMETGFAFWASKVLLTAVNLDLFTHLADRSKTADELKSDLGLQERGLADFLDTLVATGFLHRDGAGKKAFYSNTLETEVYLDKNKPSYIGGILKMANNRLFRFWGNLDEALKTGQPQNEANAGERPFFEELYANESRLEEFIAAMGGIQIVNFIHFAKKFDFKPYKTHVDIGGAGAVLSSQIAIHNPFIHSVSFDLPAVAPIAERNIEEYGVSDRVKTASGDFFNDEFPKADVITMGNILHDWDLEQKKVLIKKAYDALPVGGAFAVIENIIDDERKQNAFGLMMSLNMLIETPGGFDFTGAQFREWTAEAGFLGFEAIHLSGPASALIAYK
jgi:hypothetical protein